MPKEFSPTPLFGGAFFVFRIRPRNVVGQTYGDKTEKRMCRMTHPLFDLLCCVMLCAMTKALAGLLRTAVVGSLAGDGHIVRVAFHHTGIGDAGKLGLMQGFDVGGTTVSHAGTQAAYHLIYDLIK